MSSYTRTTYPASRPTRAGWPGEAEGIFQTRFKTQPIAKNKWKRLGSVLRVSILSSLKSAFPDLCLSQDVGEQVFGRFPWKCISGIMNDTHKQYTLLDTIFNYILYLGPPGKHLYKSKENPLHVGRLRRPTCSCFFGLKNRCFLGGPEYQIYNIYIVKYCI